MRSPNQTLIFLSHTHLLLLLNSTEFTTEFALPKWWFTIISFIATRRILKRCYLTTKNDKKKMYPLVMAARMARVREHEKDDDKLMEELGVVKKVDLVGEYQDIHDLDPEERNKLFHDYVDRNKGDWKEVVSPTGNSTWEPVGQYPPNPYGISVVRFSILGPAALNTKHNYIYNMGYDSDNYDSEDY